MAIKADVRGFSILMAVAFLCGAEARAYDLQKISDAFSQCFSKSQQQTLRTPGIKALDCGNVVKKEQGLPSDFVFSVTRRPQSRLTSSVQFYDIRVGYKNQQMQTALLLTANGNTSSASQNTSPSPCAASGLKSDPMTGLQGLCNGLNKISDEERKKMTCYPTGKDVESLQPGTWGFGFKKEKDNCVRMCPEGQVLNDTGTCTVCSQSLDKSVVSLFKMDPKNYKTRSNDNLCLDINGCSEFEEFIEDDDFVRRCAVRCPNGYERKGAECLVKDSYCSDRAKDIADGLDWSRLDKLHSLNQTLGTCSASQIRTMAQQLKSEIPAWIQKEIKSCQNSFSGKKTKEGFTYSFQPPANLYSAVATLCLGGNELLLRDQISPEMADVFYGIPGFWDHEEYYQEAAQ